MDKNQAGYQEGIVSIIVNSALFILKIWAGMVSGSIAITADAWHTLSDSFSSVIVLAGIKLSSKKPDKDHPFGHGRWEQIAALFIAFLLGVITSYSIHYTKLYDVSTSGIVAISSQKKRTEAS